MVASDVPDGRASLNVGSPLVSVVVGVRNSSANIVATLESVFSQAFVSLEVIVVDDGSEDGTGDLLRRRFVDESRLTVLMQEAAGLTKALRRGCAAATGKYIARQDAGGDASLPGRLAAQVSVLESNPALAMVCCGARFVGPRAEFLYDKVMDTAELAAGLTTDRFETIAGPPHHGGTMFRRDAYLQVGGYRPEFVVAQDIDLWLRLIEVGGVMALKEVLYEARLDVGGISSRRGHLQAAFGSAALDCARLRRSGGDEKVVLDSLYELADGELDRRTSPAPDFNYFVGNCLRRADPSGARRYYLRTLRDRPAHIGAIINYLRSFI